MPGRGCSSRAQVSRSVAPTVIVDLDGVVWLAGEVLPDAAHAIGRLRSEGFTTLFATNNSSPTLETLLHRLDRAGIPANPEELITAAIAAASLLAAEQRVMVLGEPGLIEAVNAVGAVVTDVDPEVVLVGWDRSFTFDTIAAASSAVRRGARFIATNDDATHPTPRELLPGTGALVAAVATAAETPPTIAGKPGAAMVSLINGRSDNVCAVFGDRPATDGALATQLGVPFGHVLSDAVPAHDSLATYRGASLSIVVDQFLATRVSEAAT